MADVSKKRMIIFLVASILLISYSYYFYQIFFTPNVLVGKQDRILIIPPDATFRSVQNDLMEGGFVNDMVSFSFLAKLYNYDESIKPGRYRLHRNMTNPAAIRLLQSGVQEPVNVTFNNVRLISDLDRKITRNLAIDTGDFNQALDIFIENNTEGFTRRNVIGMFIPNTYEVYYNVTAEELIDRMHDEYERFWNEERTQKAKAIGLTRKEVSTLASIVQAEATIEQENPIIAGLYINRLKRGIPLQADPTLVFAAGDFTLKRVLNEHKQIDSPYNTYKNPGLPPGPINMPYISMIDAVLNYEQHDYIYMCAREDFSGFHNFATTLAEHNRNARKYQMALTIEQRKGRALRNR